MEEEDGTQPFLEGIVVMFDYKRGYGFVECKDESYFVHISDLRDGHNAFSKLEVGEVVTFEPSENLKGKVATRVRVTGKATDAVVTELRRKANERRFDK